VRCSPPMPFQAALGRAACLSLASTARRDRSPGGGGKSETSCIQVETRFRRKTAVGPCFRKFPIVARSFSSSWHPRTRVRSQTLVRNLMQNPMQNLMLNPHQSWGGMGYPRRNNAKCAIGEILDDICQNMEELEAVNKELQRNGERWTGPKMIRDAHAELYPKAPQTLPSCAKCGNTGLQREDRTLHDCLKCNNTGWKPTAGCHMGVATVVAMYTDSCSLWRFFVTADIRVLIVTQGRRRLDRRTYCLSLSK